MEVKTKVKFALTVDGSVETFDKAAFKAKLVSYLQVDEEKLSLVVEAASVKVSATVETTDMSVATAVTSSVETLRADPSAASAALGVEVLSVSEVETEQVIVESESAQEETGLGTAGVVLVALAIVLFVIVALGIIIYANRAEAKDFPPLPTSVTVQAAVELDSISAAAGAAEEPIPDTEQPPPKERVDAYEPNYGEGQAGDDGGTRTAATVEVHEVGPAGVRVSGV